MTTEAAAQEFHHFDGYDIPVDLLRMTGAGPESFGTISESHIAQLRQEVGLNPDSSILEIGCGIGRDAIPLTKILSANGSYVGVDIIGRSIQWCQSNIGRRNPNFEFLHYDVEDQLHNPLGKQSTTEIRLPIKDQSVDRIILWSVFTHMFPTDIVHYFKEFRRILKPDGVCWATCFIYNQEILESARRTNLTPYDLRFEHEHSPGCLVNDPVHPAGAVAYSEEKLRSMIEEGGLRLVRPFVPGVRSGFHREPRGGQDAMILSA